MLILTNTIGETKLAVWTLGKPHTVAFDLEATSKTELFFVDGHGKSGRIEVGKNSFTVKLAVFTSIHSFEGRAAEVIRIRGWRFSPSVAGPPQ